MPRTPDRAPARRKAKPGRNAKPGRAATRGRDAKSGPAAKPTRAAKVNRAAKITRAAKPGHVAKPSPVAKPKPVAKSKRVAKPKPAPKPNRVAQPVRAAQPVLPAKRPSPEQIHAAAQRLGIERLHREQEQSIAAALDGRDVLLVMPTGFGKSACYQVPSLLLPSPTLVISPLLALLRDQEEKLIVRGIPSVRLDGTVRGRARRAVLERLRAGGPLLVLTTPETLGSDELRSALETSKVSLAAVDEAHCISEWGHDFRPDYLRLGARLRALGAPPLLALTATASAHVRDDIVRQLGMRDPVVIASSPHRSNLAFDALPCSGSQRLRAIVRLVKRLRRPGIVYCATTREVDEVQTILLRFGVPAHRYHGRMGAADRNAEQERFMRPGSRKVMVATSAFGLGIDKPDVRYVLHAQSPASLEQYVQEAGRAGRDGRLAHAILLHADEDRAVHEFLLAKSRTRPDQLWRLGRALGAWARAGRGPTVEGLALSAEVGQRVAAALLALIADAGLVRWKDSAIEITTPAGELEAEVRDLASRFETLRTQDARRLDAIAAYAHATECRVVWLRRYFGEEPGEPCGKCDVDRGRVRTEGFWEPLERPSAPSGAMRGARRSRRRRRGRRGGRQG
jgi:ATP-dependent DNA helicase RecQ